MHNLKLVQSLNLALFNFRRAFQLNAASTDEERHISTIANALEEITSRALDEELAK